MSSPTLQSQAVDTSVARSWLLRGPANYSDIVAAESSGADVVVLDLEDSVAENEKHQARENVWRWLDQGKPTWVRINDVCTPHWSHDLDMLSSVKGVAGVMLAKAEHHDQIAATAARLPAGTPIVALVESALGLEEARGIASASGVLRLAFGTGDFRKDIGAAADPVSLAYARSRLVVASRAERIHAPIDGPTLTDSIDEYRAGITVGIAAGMTGKLCLSSQHARLINNELTPSAADVRWAEATIARLGVDGAQVKYGSERPQLERARKIRELVAAFSR
ncbi:HpcH/HpaI aldolase/citrate lyase family protein [Hoyosella altamirensis]|uniref:Citrate lyase subunit beta/citryl-CoA lyase n=1 Tax=Hoyosella altamirensis TaxID=616997 RepID=A0A839RR87_9ACTN|nr:aldolase/citrate lyase family protein [Hoyosella altamirensis]MBB3038839.1 citrate lyase subunit beta/citryl-CoA lyase [Hoyosella altamirensis]